MSLDSRGRQVSRILVAQWVMLGVGLLVLGAAIGLNLYSEHGAVEAGERERLATQARMIDQHLGPRLATAYATLAAVRDNQARWAANGGQAALSRQLEVLSNAMQEVRTVGIIDAKGVASASSRPQLVGMNFFERAYFQTARGGGDPSVMYVAQPAKTVLGAFAINMVRVRLDARGRFAGVVMIVLDPDYFRTLLDSVRYAPDMRAALVHGDGVQLMMVSEREGVTDVDLRQPESFFSRHLASARSESLLTGFVPASGEELMVALRTIRPEAAHMDKALVVAVSRELSAVLAGWRAAAYRQGGAFAVLALIACLSLYLYQRREQAYGRLLSARAAERTRAERELRESAARYQAVTESANEAIVSVDGSGMFVDWNPAFEKLFGYSESEISGQGLKLVIPQRYQQRHQEGMARRLADGATPLGGKSIELTARRRDGSEFSMELTVAAWKTEQGRFFTGILRDITERKRIASQLAEQKGNLEQLVASRTAELQRALEAAKLADQTKDAFLANMSHELRTPLNAVIGMANLARGGASEPKQRDYLDKIITSGRHLNRVVNDLLDLSKIAAGKMAVETVAFRLRDLVMRSRSVMAHRAAEKGLVLAETIAAEVPEVLLGDPLRIEQIILNLLANAIKFTPAGRVDLAIGVPAREGDRVCLDIDVRDTGIGMRPADLERLFQPFFQADLSASRSYGGTGLGLTISRRLAQMMGGDISVDSREGAGSAFRVRIWLGLGDPAQLPPSDPLLDAPAPSRYRDVRVLVAEDQPLNREIVEALLAKVGIVSCAAENGQQALDILDQSGAGAFDLVLMDVQMPIIDGLSLTRTLRRRSEFAALPIIGMTAHTMEHEKRIGFEAGMNDHIGKPFDNASFYRTLAKWIAPAKRDRAPAREADRAGPYASAAPPPQGIDSEGGLARFAGNSERYHHWLAKFVEEAAAKFADLGNAVGAGQAEAARKSAHSIKGQAGMLGLTDLHGMAAALEAEVARGEPCDATLARMQAEAQRLRQTLGSAAPALGAVAAPQQAERRARQRAGEKLVLLIDDDPAVLEALGESLQQRYLTRVASSGAAGLELARMWPQPDLVLLDIELPDIEGYAVCSELKAHPATAAIPVIFLSSHTNVIDITHGLELGAVDYVSKPVEIPILLARVQTQLRLRETSDLLRDQNVNLEALVAARTLDLQARTAELQQSQDLSIVALGSIAETRDNETGNHIYRTSAYVEALAARLALRPQYRGRLEQGDWEKIWKSAPLHDIGKVGIPDHILLKPGPLTAAEFAVMKRHTTLGRDAIRSAEVRAGAESSFLRMASEIAYSHHERWDGRGYPEGLAAEAIPLPARLMSVADVYDALISERVYKAAMSHATAVGIIRAGSGSQFDPLIVDCFVEASDEFARIAARFSDDD